MSKSNGVFRVRGRGGQSQCFCLRYIRRSDVNGVSDVLVNRYWASVRLSDDSPLWVQVSELRREIRRLCVVRPEKPQ